MTHTPGPWQIDYDGINGNIASIGPIYGSLELDPGNPYQMANAHLVSAAPDLLAACEGILAAFKESVAAGDDWTASIVAAVTKAKGS